LLNLYLEKEVKSIKILSTCCDTLFKNVDAAVKQTGVECKMEKVSDYKTIAEYGVMRTPALVIDEKVVVSGRLPSVEEIMKLLS
jgi:small redox-active disulfide protein 2